MNFDITRVDAYGPTPEAYHRPPRLPSWRATPKTPERATFTPATRRSGPTLTRCIAAPRARIELSKTAEASRCTYRSSERVCENSVFEQKAVFEKGNFTLNRCAPLWHQDMVGRIPRGPDGLRINPMGRASGIAVGVEHLCLQARNGSRNRET